MKKLLICCLSGETANILAKKMQKIADAQGLNLLISAVGLENVFSVAPAYNAVLVAPHIQYKRDEIANVLQDYGEGNHLILPGEGWINREYAGLLDSVKNLI